MNGVLPYCIYLKNGGFWWTICLDYEKIPFRCEFYHDTSHILHDCSRYDFYYKKRRDVGVVLPSQAPKVSMLGSISSSLGTKNKMEASPGASHTVATSELKLYVAPSP